MKNKKQNYINNINIFVLITLFFTQSNILGNLSPEIINKNTSNLNILNYPIAAGDHDPIFINGTTELESFINDEGLLGEGTKDSPYIIENFIIDAGTANGIDIRNTDTYLIIQNCVIGWGVVSDNSGIYLNNVSNIIINNNDLDYNRYGIFMIRSNNSIIFENNMNNNDDGIKLYESNNNTLSKNNAININNGIILYKSNNNTLSGNYACFHSKIGIDLTISDYNTLSGNNASYNDEYGFDISGSSNNVISENIANNNDRGFFVRGESNNNTLYGNEASNNEVFGFGLWYESKNNIIFGNKAHKNNWGFYVTYESSNNTIYFNDIYVNYYDQVTEGVDCLDNHWDNGTTGNYWGGYTWKYPDATNNGVVWDTPYEIYSEGPGIDHFPLVFAIFLDDEASKFTNFPRNFSAEKGYSNLSISWKVQDLHPETYNIELNGTEMVNGNTWNSGIEIYYDIPNGLLKGIYNITIIVSDEIGHISQHTVIFTVYIRISGFPLVYMLIFISVGVFLLKRKIKK
jgi:parallel beta-helix repeat protein